MSVHSIRYADVTEEKATGSTYTPKILADFVSEKIVEAFKRYPIKRPLRILDPAIGDGELLISLLGKLQDQCDLDIEVHGFELNQNELNISKTRIGRLFPQLRVNFEAADFLEYVIRNFGFEGNGNLFSTRTPETFDIIIANPPYVRTQIMGARQAQILSKQFGLAGRVDLYYAFIVAMAKVLEPRGIAGIIVSNRFMTTRSGASVRQALRRFFNLRHIWDLGDTKLFNAAVLPAVILAEGKNGQNSGIPEFTSIYQTNQAHSETASSPIQALSCNGVVQLEDSRRFFVHHGKLNMSGTQDSVWRLTTDSVESWLKTVERNTWGTFGDIGNIRVGVKTCADNIFIRSDWHDLPEEEQPELLKPIITHHIARRFKSLTPEKHIQILYPYEATEGRRQTIDLSRYPRSKAYLERHRAALENRKYVIEAGRKWYEIWVSQDPSAWNQTKLVFRDIAEEPIFWIDKDGSVVNGDCYWIICHNQTQTKLLWLAAAVGNSSFIKRFYDYNFQNKLYSGRRRFITQYVEKFPLPDPKSDIGKKIITKAQNIYECITSSQAESLQIELNQMVWEAFGLSAEEITR
jgi:adenine-specific DNA-methyltransferase